MRNNNYIAVITPPHHFLLLFCFRGRVVMGRVSRVMHCSLCSVCFLPIYKLFMCLFDFDEFISQFGREGQRINYEQRNGFWLDLVQDKEIELTYH